MNLNTNTNTNDEQNESATSNGVPSNGAAEMSTVLCVVGASEAPEAGVSTVLCVVDSNGTGDANPGEGENLTPEHARKLQGIRPEVRAVRGYHSAFTADELDLLGFAKKQKWVPKCLPALVIPMWNVVGANDLNLIRPDNPRFFDGRLVKYELAAGKTMGLDVHPLIQPLMDDPERPLYITEGPIKADHAISHGLCCIALVGVWTWRGKGGKGGKTTLADWDEIALEGRHVHVVFDSDARRNPHVRGALERLVGILQLRKAMVHVILLEDTPEGEKVGLDDFFVAGGTVDQLAALEGPLPTEAQCRREATKRAAQQRQARVKAKGEAQNLPVIHISGRQLSDLMEEISAAFEAMNGHSPRLFQGPNGLVVISNDVTGAAQLEQVTSPGLQVMASEAALWVDHKGEAIPPRDLMDNFLSSKANWRLPAVQRVAYVPFYAKDGTLCDRDGYHAEAQVWLQLPPNFALPDTTPTPENVAAARTLLFEKALEGVAFVDAASRAHGVALMLQPIVRLLIDGATPLYLYEAPTQSSGKSYAARLSITPHTKPISMIDMKSAEEWEKTIFSAFLEGRSHLFFDNITSKLQSPALASFLTEPIKSQRVLGVSKIVTVYTWQGNWIATANNATLSADAGSRIVKIRLDTKMSTPEERQFAGSPERYIQENRGEVFGALLTLVRAWMEAGRPEYTATKHRFEEWSRTMGGILEVAGIEGFLANLAAERENMDPDKEIWREFVAMWFQTFGEEEVKARQLLGIVSKCEGVKETIGEKEDGQAQRLGNLLGARREQTFDVEGIQGGLQIKRASGRSNKGMLWYVKSLQPPDDSGGTTAPTPTAPDGTSPSGGTSPCDGTSAPAAPVREESASDLHAKKVSVADMSIEDVLGFEIPGMTTLFAPVEGAPTAPAAPAADISELEEFEESECEDTETEESESEEPEFEESESEASGATPVETGGMEPISPEPELDPLAEPATPVAEEAVGETEESN